MADYSFKGSWVEFEHTSSCAFKSKRILQSLFACHNFINVNKLQWKANPNEFYPATHFT